MNTDILRGLIITKVYSASTYYTPENIRKKNDRHRWAAVIKYEGETVYTSNGKQFLSDLHHIALLPKGCSYAWECTKPGHFCIIEFECETSYYEPIVCTVKSGEKILKIFKELEYRRNLNSPTADLESIRNIYSILLTLIQTPSEAYIASEKQRKITSAVEYISKHYNESLTNDILAKEVGLSTVYFRRLFTTYMGMPPIAYVHKLRIEKAKEMLKSDYGSISHIALFLGYASIYDFSRDFKKHTGVPPSKY